MFLLKKHIIQGENMQKGCPKCGRMIETNETICPYCHYNFKEIDNFFKKVSDRNFLENEKYAGFTKRLVAGLFDCFILLVLTYFILIAIDKWWFKVTLNNLYIGIFIFIPLYILINSLLERTSWRGSLGKYILKIQVVDEYENPVTFPIALKRNILKILNIITLGIGFLLTAFPPTKQSLSDKVSKTFVINKLALKETDNLIYGSAFKRLTAFITDLLIIGLICFGLLKLTDLIINKDTTSNETINMIKNARFIICLVIIFFYFPFGESRNGTTIGKKMAHLKVVKSNGNTMWFIRAFIRQFLIILDIITLGFILPFVTPKKQTIKDILTETVVIDG